MCLFKAAVSEQPSNEQVEVLPGLWLGSMRAAHDVAWMREAGVGAVLNMAADCVDEPADGYPDTIRTMRIAAEDSPDYPLLARHLPASFAFVSECLDEVPPRPVLVHCVQGINRSGAVVVACVMLRSGIPLLDALYHVSMLRSGIVNNDYFQAELVLLAHANRLLKLGPQSDTAKALAEHGARVRGIYGVLADPRPAGPLGTPHLSSTSFRAAMARAAPELSEEDVDMLEQRLSWFRDDGTDGVDGVGQEVVCNWLSCDAKAMVLALHPLLNALRASGPGRPMIAEKVV